MYQADSTMDNSAQQYKKMFKELVMIPAVREKMSWARKVVIQHDGVRTLGVFTHLHFWCRLWDGTAAVHA